MMLRWISLVPAATVLIATAREPADQARRAHAGLRQALVELCEWRRNILSSKTAGANTRRIVRVRLARYRAGARRF